MGNRCENCSKMVSLETAEPDDVVLAIENRYVIATTRLVRICAECGEEMKEIELEAQVEIPEFCDCPKDERIWEINEESSEITEEGGGRYAKSYIGFETQALVSCVNCSKEISASLGAKAAASEFEDLN